MPAPFTIDLNLTGRLAVVVGLGVVGRRKLEGLIASGAKILGVDPIGFDGELPHGVQIAAEAYRADHLEGASLAFAAAPAEVNKQVVADANARGIWVNAASDPSSGDFAVPAVWQDGKIRLTVSTSGASPALAASLRDRAAQAIGPVAADLASLFAEMRPRVLAEIHGARARNEILKAWGSPKWLDLAESRGIEAARRALIEQIEGAASLRDP